MEILICNQHGEKFAILNTEKKLWMNIKIEAIKNAICLLFLQYRQKI